MLAMYAIIILVGAFMGTILMLSVYELAMFLILRLLGCEVVALRFGVPEEGATVRRRIWFGTPVYFSAPFLPVATLFLQRVGTDPLPRIRSSMLSHLARIFFGRPIALEHDYVRVAEIAEHPRRNVSIAHNLLAGGVAFLLVFPASFVVSLPIGFARNYTISAVPTVGEVTDQRASEAGFREGDRIVAINSIEVATWGELAEEIMRHRSAEEPASFAIERDGEVLSIMYRIEQTEAGGRIAGIRPGREPRWAGLDQAVRVGTVMMTEATPGMIAMFFGLRK